MMDKAEWIEYEKEMNDLRAENERLQGIVAKTEELWAYFVVNYNEVRDYENYLFGILNMSNERQAEVLKEARSEMLYRNRIPNNSSNF
jgi:hypothetical protein